MVNRISLDKESIPKHQTTVNSNHVSDKFNSFDKDEVDVSDKPPDKYYSADKVNLSNQPNQDKEKTWRKT